MARKTTKKGRKSKPGKNTVKSTRHDFAPTCVWTFKVPGHEILNQRLLVLIENERRKSPQSRECEGREMWQSQRSVGADPPVKELFKTIFRMANNVAEFLRWDVADCTPVCRVCWANVHSKGSYHTRHVHSSSYHLSGVYFIQAP